MTKLSHIKSLLASATPVDKTTAQYNDPVTFECPHCNGDGEIEGDRYVNIDGKAINVMEFSGFCDEYQLSQEFYHTMINNAEEMLKIMEAQNEALKAQAAASDVYLDKTGEALELFEKWNANV